MIKDDCFFITIDDGKKVDEFLERIIWLHDAELKKVKIEWPGTVFQNGYMVGDGEYSDAVVIFHSQNAGSPIIEMLFEELYEFNYNAGNSFDPEFELTKDAVSFYPCGKSREHQYVIKSKRVKYRILGWEHLPTQKEWKAKQALDDKWN